MKKTIVKKGFFSLIDESSINKTDLNLNALIYTELKRLGLLPNDPCCIGDEPVVISEKVDTFTNLTSGNTVTLTETPISTNIPMIFRNGRYQVLTTDYTIVGTLITFIKDFGVSSGASGFEEVSVVYKYQE